MPRAAVRLLHARVPDHGHGVRSRTTRTRREEEAREAISGNLCRCTGYQNIVASRCCGPPRSRRRATAPAMTHPAVRRAGPAGRGRRLRHRRRRASSTTSATTRSAAAFVRSPHAHARVVDIDVDRGARRRRAGRHLHLRRPARRAEGSAVTEPLPLLIPHPSLHPPRTGYALASDEVNHVGEAIVMVVARDRYVAEDAAERMRGDLRPAAAGRRRRRGRRGRAHRCTPTCRTTSRPTWSRRSATSTRRWPRRRTRCELDLTSSAAPRCRWRARACYARWDAGRRLDAGVLLDPDVDRRAGRRRGQAGLPLDKVECVAPMVGGGFGVKIVHPWPEEVLVPWAARRARPRGRSGSRTGASTSSRRRTSAARCSRSRSASTTRAGCSRSTCAFWHDNGAYTPYGVIVPIITSTQLLGPYKPGAYRVRVLVALHQHRHRHAVPRRRPAAGRLRHGAHDGRDRRRARPGPGRGAGAQLHPARRDALRPPADLPGRPAADLRLRRLPGVAGEAEEAGRLGRLRGRSARRRGPRAGRSASAWPATSRAPASGRTRARTCWSRPSGKVKVATGLTTQGQGHQTAFAQIAADELGVPLERRRGRHRRHPAVRLRRRAPSPPGPP